jgi:hypothetical protein
MVVAKDWIKKLEEMTKKGENKPPNFSDGKWFTLKEARENFGVGENKTRQLVSRGLKDGEIETYSGNIWSPKLNQLIRQVWYRFTSPK